MKKQIDSMIQAEDITFEYIRRDGEDNVIAIDTAVNKVSFEIHPGEFVAILGHNGSGKSTLAKHLNAILTPSEGALYVEGMNTQDKEVIWDVRKEVGMVFQNPDNQIVHNVVEEDVGFGPENLGVPTSEIWKRVEQALDKVSMLKYRKKSPNTLSGGQKQRVAIAGILAMHPKCIVLDEATAMLDPRGRRKVLAAVQELNKQEKITIVYITHYMEEVTEADHVIVMDHGSVAMEGTPREIFSKVEELRELHLDVPQPVLLAHQLRQQGMPIPEHILTTEELVDALVPLLSSDREVVL